MKTAVTISALVSAISLAVASAVEPTAKPPQSAAKAKEDADNLLVNGDFEEGETPKNGHGGKPADVAESLTPKGWQTVDGLTSFWVKDSDPKHGKVLKFDTDVLQSQAYDWWVEIAKNGASPRNAPKKIPSTDPNKYDTIAAFDGVFFWSDPIPIKKGKAYWLSLDVKGQPGMMVWLVGYPEKPSSAFGADMAAFSDYLKEKKVGKPIPKGRNFDPFIHTYIWKGQLMCGGGDEWKTYSRRQKPFRPTANTPKVRYVRVFLLPYWPPGTYYVDNVRLTEYQEKE